MHVCLPKSHACACCRAGRVPSAAGRRRKPAVPEDRTGQWLRVAGTEGLQVPSCGQPDAVRSPVLTPSVQIVPHKAAAPSKTGWGATCRCGRTAYATYAGHMPGPADGGAQHISGGVPSAGVVSHAQACAVAGPKALPRGLNCLCWRPCIDKFDPHRSLQVLSIQAAPMAGRHRTAGRHCTSPPTC